MIQMTPSAIDRVKTIIKKKNKSDLFLRLQVDSGGCAGFEYKFSLNEEQNPDDKLFIQDDVKLLIDEVSLQFVENATIHFENELVGASFKVINPDTESSCGCGNSFSV